MGSTGPYMTVAEAAELLGVTPKMVHIYSRRQLLEAHYPSGRRAGMHFMADDVVALAELRGADSDFMRKLPQIAMRAFVASRRVEKKLEALMYLLGLGAPALSLEKDDVIQMHLQAERAIMRGTADPAAAREWARRFGAFTEEYLELVHLHVGTEEPWKVYLHLGRDLAARLKDGTEEKAFVEHARAHIRNVAYFYERGRRGARAANKMFPNERYSGRLLQRLYPI